ncbi:L-lactate dehydrogenase [Clostridiaceae bacterium JG1575]|nr:L-lactate dehydrogenase [Clostridiaceae bacterium JG1575]
MKMKKGVKLSVVGAGFVGSAVTFALAQKGLAQEIVLVDREKKKAEGEVMDIAHGAAFYPPVALRAGSYEDTKDSDLVILTAGANQKEGESRLDLLQRNAAIYRDMIPQIAKASPQAILLVVANPVDLLSYLTYRLSGFPSRRVLGSGTVLDSSRLRYVLGRAFEVDARSVHAHIAGEHGDSEFALWSSAAVGSVPLAQAAENEGLDLEKLQQEALREVRGSAAAIISRKGYTNYAVALAVRRITEAILRDERRILSVSNLDEQRGVYYSVPRVVGRHGVEKEMVPDLSDEETMALEDSSSLLYDLLKNLAERLD